MNKQTMTAFLVAFMIGGMLTLGVHKASATFSLPKVNICHKEGNGEYHTLNIAIPAAIAHLQQHEDDYTGECRTEPEPSPSPSPSVEPSPEPSVEPSPSPSVEPSPSPSVEPSPEPSGSPEPSDSPSPSPSESPSSAPSPSVSTQVPGQPSCDTAPVEKTVANFHLLRRGDEAILHWVPTQGSHVNIYYKQNTSADWQYSVILSSNDGEELVDHLGSMDITFAIQQVDGCKSGPLSSPIVDGPTRRWILFR